LKNISIFFFKTEESSSLVEIHSVLTFLGVRSN